jgi:hypothetical protein
MAEPEGASCRRCRAAAASDDRRGRGIAVLKPDVLRNLA